MINERLKILRSKVHKNQQEFADLLGIKRAGYNLIENNKREMTMRVLHALVKSTSCNTHWLLTGEGEMFITDREYASDKSCQILHVESDIAAGEPVEATGERLDSFSIGLSFLQNVNDYFCFRVNGRSMEPDVQNDDLVIIKKDINWNDKDNIVCAVRIDGDITLKRIQHDYKQKMIVLTSDNKDYPPIIVNPKHSDAFMIGCLYLVVRRVE
jgi:SOS-response transcriptional repressor LexA